MTTLAADSPTAQPPFSSITVRHPWPTASFAEGGLTPWLKCSRRIIQSKPTRESITHTHTHKHTSIYIYIYIYILKKGYILLILSFFLPLCSMADKERRMNLMRPAFIFSKVIFTKMTIVNRNLEQSSPIRHSARLEATIKNMVILWWRHSLCVPFLPTWHTIPLMGLYLTRRDTYELCSHKCNVCFLLK